MRRKLTTSTHVDYGLHGNGFVVQFPAGTEDYFPHRNQTGFCGPSRLPLIDTARPTTEEKRPGIDTEHSSSRADFRNEWSYNPTSLYALYRVSQEECARLREGVPYIKVYRYNTKHQCPKLNGYGDKGARKVWSSCGSTYCTWFA